MRILLILLFLTAGITVSAQILLPGQVPLAPRQQYQPPARYQQQPMARHTIPNPFRDPNQPLALPEPRLDVYALPKIVNVDTALAKLMQSAGNFYASGTMKFWNTNGTKVVRKIFPFSLCVLDGRIRTQLDLRYIPKDFTKSGTWAAMRQIGINSIITVTLPRLNTVKISFPSVEAYIIHGMDRSDVPGFMRIEKQLFGPQSRGNRNYDKYNGFLNYNTGDRIPFELWQSPGENSLPAYVKINHRLGSAVDIHFTKIEKVDLSKVPKNFFDIPEGFTVYSGMSILMQEISENQSPGLGPNSIPIIRPRGDGSFLRR